MNTTNPRPPSGVRQSSDAKNVFFVEPEPGSTLQSIGLQQWSMPWLSDVLPGSYPQETYGQTPLYTLLRVLGYGSYSCVCLAVDNRLAAQGHPNPLVALKRVPNVLADHRQAKLVLRELAVLRRVRHPNVLQLRSAFLRPSSVGQCRLIGGRLVHTAVDLYMATEFAEGGDLYSLKGQLSEGQVTAMLWDMLEGVRYLHSCGIWHRDVKSQNAFLFREVVDGEQTWRVKLGDFGSSVWRGTGTGAGSGKDGVGDEGGGGALARGLSVDVSSADEEGDIDVALNECRGAAGGYDGDGADDGYESDVDTRAMRDGKSESGSYSDLSAHRAISQCCNSGKTYASNGNHLLTRQVCTPCYRAPEVVLSRGGYTDAVDMWGLGCIFGELLSRISYVGSSHNTKLRVAPLFAVRDFLSVTPMPGETFTNTKKELDALFKVLGTPSWRDIEQVPMAEWRSYLRTLPGRAPMVMRRFKHAGEVAIHLLTRLLEFDPSRRLTCEEAMRHEYFSELRDEEEEGGMMMLEGDEDVVAGMGDVDELSPAINRQLSIQEDATGVNAARKPQPPQATPLASPSVAPQPPQTTPIGVALRLLEEEIDKIMHEDAGADDKYHRDFFSPTTQRLLAMLTAECEAVTAEHDDIANNTANDTNGEKIQPPKSSRKEKLNKNGSKTSLVEDVVMDDAEYARARMSNRADTSAGEALDASKFLKANRHGEWSEWSSERAGDGRRGVSTAGWGVSATGEYAEAIRRQQMK